MECCWLSMPRQLVSVSKRPKSVNAYLALLNFTTCLGLLRFSFFSPPVGRFEVNHSVPSSLINFYIVHTDCPCSLLLFFVFAVIFLCKMLVSFVIAFVQSFSHWVVVFVLLSEANIDAAGLLWYSSSVCMFPPLWGGVACLVMLQNFSSRFRLLLRAAVIVDF